MFGQAVDIYSGEWTEEEFVLLRAAARRYHAAAFGKFVVTTYSNHHLRTAWN